MEHEQRSFIIIYILYTYFIITLLQPSWHTLTMIFVQYHEPKRLKKKHRVTQSTDIKQYVT